MNTNSVEGLFRETLDKIRTIVDVNTVVGKPIFAGETTILPVSKASIGLVVGGGDTQKANNPPFAGGTGAGVNITPVGFLVINKDKFEMLSVDNSNNYSEFFGFAGKIVEALSKTEIGTEIVKTISQNPIKALDKTEKQKNEKNNNQKSKMEKTKKSKVIK